MPEKRLKKRVTITLSVEMHDRMRALAPRWGGNVSGIIERSLEQTMPIFEVMADAMETSSGDVLAEREAVANGLANYTVRTLLEAANRLEDDE